MKNLNNNKKIQPKKVSEHLISTMSHSINEEKTLKKFLEDNPEFFEKLDDLDLAKVRISQKNLVYVIGLSSNIAKEETLLKNEYFGQYGHISKIVVYKNNSYNRGQQYSPSLSAYLTFSDEKEASLAIFAVDGFELNEKILHCSYGTTKYCTYFLRDQSCPNRQECVYLHYISKDHEYYYLNNHKNGTEDQKNSILNILRRHKTDFINFVSSHNKSEAPKTIFPSIFKIMFDLEHIFMNEIGNEEIMDTSKNTQKAIFSKSHSSNSEDYNKPISTHSTLKKQTSITKTNKLNPHKLINTVDWEDEKKELNYEKKSPELKNKLSDDFKSVSTEKEHTSLNNNTDFNINNNNNSSEKNVDDSSKFRLKTQTNSISTVELKEKEIKSSLENDNPMLTEEKSDEKCQRTTSPKEKSLNLNNSEEKMKRNECEIISPKSHKISSEINETKRNNADDSEINIYGQFNFCNELEIKIIKNMLNETNQRSRFSFVQHSERKSGKDIQENSLKEILLSSLKLNEFKRSSSLNFYELLDSSEKKASYYSHDVNGTEKMGANLFNAYSNLENNLKTHKSSPYDYNDNNDDFNESSVTKKI